MKEKNRYNLHNKLQKLKKKKNLHWGNIKTANYKDFYRI